MTDEFTEQVDVYKERYKAARSQADHWRHKYEFLQKRIEQAVELLEKGTIETDEILADLLFAYANKDEDSSHTFEFDAVRNAVVYLLKNYSGQKYTKDFFLGAWEEIKQKAKAVEI